MTSSADKIDLAPYATTESLSKGRRHQEPGPSFRSEFQRDRDRIVHCAAFRRLEYKTQVFVNHEGDMFRTRMTHTMEVSQIARSIARTLGVNEDLTEAIALAHDLGHTPFGHAGQDILNHCMRSFGGFEHNMQALRIVEELEERYAEFNGLNLCYETREGILKHCSLAQAQQLGELGLRFINKEQASIEAQVTNMADEIAYLNHDVDDGLRSGLLSLSQLREVELFENHYKEIFRRYPDLPERRTIHEVVRRMVNTQVTDLVETSLSNLESVSSVGDVVAAEAPLIGYSSDMLDKKQALRKFLRINLYQHYRVHRMSEKGRRIIANMFEAFMNDSRLLPTETQQRLRQQRDLYGDDGKARCIADYIAGMTDRFAIKEYQRLFSSENLP